MGSERDVYAPNNPRPCKLHVLFFVIMLGILLCFLGIVATIFRSELSQLLFGPNPNDVIYLDQFNQPFKWQSTRLPRWFIPSENKLLIVTKDQNEWRNSFYIKNEIKFDVIDTSNFLILHFAHTSLQAEDISCVSNATGRPSPAVTVSKTTYSHGTLDMYCFQLSRALKPHEQCTITLFGDGSISNSADGFFYDEYISTELTENLRTETSYALVTQMEPVFARKVFPCFDEPNFKVKFSLSATFYVEIFDFVLFNTPMLSESDNVETKQKTMTFTQTVLMPSYVVAIIFGKNYHYASKKAEKTELRNYPVVHTIFYPKELETYAKEPLKLAVDSMIYFEQAFGIPFPMEKCDHFPVRNMNMGGMENWGLITYLLSKLLYKSENSGLRQEVERATLVTHEMAHQWFGNLVTLEWWDELWLNEGFARFMERLALESVRPQYKAVERFYNDGTVLRTLHLDALQTTHPIHTGSDSGNFDDITYTKGSAVLFMLENFIGNDLFLSGVGNYLQKFKYGNAKSKHLWIMMTEVSGNSFGDLSSVMNQWINHKHTPIVSVRFDDSSIHLEQTVFCYTCNSTTGFSPWSIPLTVQTKEKLYTFSDDKPGNIHTFMFNKMKASIPLDRARPDWVKFNLNGTGLYRVLYQNDGIFEAFSRTIVEESDRIPYMDRGNLLVDTLTLAKLGYISYIDALPFVTTILEKENTEGALQMAFDFSFGFLDLFQRLKRNGNELVTQQYVAKYLGKFYPGLDADSWNEEKRDFNIFILSILCQFGYESCLQDCSQLMLKMIEANGEIYIHPSIKEIFYPTIAQYGTLSQWEYMYTDATVSKRHDINLYQFWKSPDANLIKRYLTEQYFDSDRPQISSLMLNALVQSSRNNLPGALIAWDLVKTHWDAIFDEFGQFDFLAEGIDFILLNFDTPGQLKDLIHAGETLTTLGSSSILDQGEETITFNIEWKNLYLDEVVHILKVINLQ